VLVKNKAQVNEADKDGRTCLHIASENEDLRSVELLVDARAEIDVTDNSGWSALFYASSKGSINIVIYLLGKSANANLSDIDGNTCLHIAIKNKAILECVKLLVDHDVQINCQNNNQETPLHLAASEGDEDIVAVLLERGAEPNIQNSNGQTSNKSSLCGCTRTIKYCATFNREKRRRQLGRQQRINSFCHSRAVWKKGSGKFSNKQA
jgi:uncharacterized protein